MSKKPRGHIHKIREFELEKVSEHLSGRIWFYLKWDAVQYPNPTYPNANRIRIYIRTSFVPLLFYDPAINK